VGGVIGALARSDLAIGVDFAHLDRSLVRF
jgi:predicted nuclease with TOPRIM domain